MPTEALGHRILLQASEKLGGHAALAHYLSVSPDDLQRWIDGEAVPPGETILRAADLLVGDTMRQSKTQTLIESHQGQHLALSVAAHLARAQLVPHPLKVYHSQHMAEMVDTLANALARIATLYVRDTTGAEPRELALAELEGSTVRGAGTMLVLKDGRALSSVCIKRGDLRQAIAILKATGIPGFAPQRSAPEMPAPRTTPSVIGQIAELEALLRPPLVESRVERANALAVAIARIALQSKARRATRRSRSDDGRSS